MLALIAACVAVLYLILDALNIGSDLFNAHTGLLICTALLAAHVYLRDRGVRYGRSGTGL